MNYIIVNKRTQDVLFIIRLFFGRGPATVFSAIISIIINPVYTCSRFPKILHMFKIRFVHIISKFFKRPPKTFDSSATVSVPPVTFWTCASHFNIYKYLPKSSFTLTMSPEFFTDRIAYIIKSASTASGVPTCNVISIGHHLISAITFKKPLISESTILPIFSRMKANRNKSTKFLARDISPNSKDITSTPFIPRNIPFWESIRQIFQTIWMHKNFNYLIS